MKTAKQKIKKNIVAFLMVLLLSPLAIHAQDVFAKYSDSPDVTFIDIKPKMFQLLAKMDIESEDEEAQDYLNMVNSITSLRTIVTDNKTIATDLLNWVSKNGAKLEELMEVKDDGKNIKFFVKEGKDENHVRELLIFVDGLSSLENQVKVDGKALETVLVSLTGDINLKEVSKLTKKMDIPGGEHLDKK